MMFVAVILDAHTGHAVACLPPRVKPVEGVPMPFLAVRHWDLLTHTLAYAAWGHRFGGRLTVFIIDSINTRDFVEWMNAFTESNDGFAHHVLAKLGPFDGMTAYTRFLDEMGKRLDKGFCADEIDGEIACREIINRWRC